MIYHGEFGGGLAVALCQQLQKHALPSPASLVLLYPWLDVTMSHPQSRKLERKDFILACDGLAACGVAYAGEREPTDPLVSPLFGAVEGLPKTAVFPTCPIATILPAFQTTVAFSNASPSTG